LILTKVCQLIERGGTDNSDDPILTAGVVEETLPASIGNDAIVEETG
jgi:hypothetical protein